VLSFGSRGGWAKSDPRRVNAARITRKDDSRRVNAARITRKNDLRQGDSPREYQ